MGIEQGKTKENKGKHVYKPTRKKTKTGNPPGI
jgi:hypothetical protein